MKRQVALLFTLILVAWPMVARGGGPIHAKNLRAVLRSEAAELIVEVSPEGKHVAEGFRVSDIQRKTRTEKE